MAYAIAEAGTTAATSRTLPFDSTAIEAQARATRITSEPGGVAAWRAFDRVESLLDLGDRGARR